MPNAEEDDLELVRRGTRFANAKTEDAYRAWHVEQAVPFNRAAMLASLGCWAALSVTSALWVPSVTAPWYALFAAMMSVISASLVVISRPGLRAWMQPSVMLANFVAGNAAVCFGMFAIHSVEISVLGVVLTNFFGFALFRLRPSQAAAAVLPYMLLAAVGVVVAVRTGYAHVPFSAFWGVTLFFAAGPGLQISVVLDVLSRQSYRQQRIIESQARTIARERARSEALLKQEVAHQVAERSKELGLVLSRAEAPLVVAPLASGDRFDARYVIERALGAGGMGAVYAVKRLTDGEKLALKIVIGEVSGIGAARFAREAEIGARVRHRNLVSIVDVGISTGGVPFLVMEMAQHGSLEEHRSRFGDEAWALPILGQIAGGLAALHAAGVVHRDLKPGNVLFTAGEDGVMVAKISDFGISRFGAGDGADDGEVDPGGATLHASPSAPQPLTATGSLLGTPYYMAPESRRGGTVVQAPADVFAFGILACEMLTGTTPFPVPPVLLAMAGQAVKAQSPTFGPGVGATLRAALLSCLEEDPTRRPTMRALVGMLPATEPPRVGESSAEHAGVAGAVRPARA